MERRSKADSRQESLSEYTFPVGIVLGFQGLAGEVKVRPATNTPELLAELETVKVEYASGVKLPAGAESILSVTNVRLDKRMVLLTFANLPDRTAVEHLQGARLLMRESELLPLEEEGFWVKDLVGMDAYTLEGVLIGTICSIIPAGTDVIEIKPVNQADGKTILVPFVKTLVPRIDRDKRRVEIDAIPGLLEPQ